MARPLKEGVDYWPHECDMDSDSKVAFIEAKHGIVGYGVWLKLLTRIYRDHGYWIEWNETEQYVFARMAGVERDKVVEIVTDCMEVGLLNRKVFDEHTVLTSKGIQDRYKLITKGRKNSGKDLRYWLDESYSENNPPETVVIDAHNPSTTELSDGLIRKGKESKEKGKESKSSSNPSFAVTALHSLEKAMTEKYGDIKTAAAWPHVLAAIGAGCPPGCRALHCTSEPCFGLVMTVVAETNNPAKLADFIKQRRKK